MTKGEVLRYAIAFALRRSRKVVRGLKEGLTEDERHAVADHAVTASILGLGAQRALDHFPPAKPNSHSNTSFCGKATAVASHATRRSIDLYS